MKKHSDVPKIVAAVLIFSLFQVLFPGKSHAAITRLDTSFDNDGVVTFDLGTGGYSVGLSVNILDNDSYLIGGNIDNPRRSILIKYDHTGQLDTSFNSQGYVIDNSFPYGTYIPHTIVDGDKFVTTGHYYNQSTSQIEQFVMRKNADGTVDQTFGEKVDPLDPGSTRKGYIILPHQGMAAMVQKDNNGKYITLGISSSYPNRTIFIARLTYDGELDTTFNSTGYILESDNAYAKSIIVDGDKYLTVGREASNNEDVEVRRYNYDGTLDSSFGIAGKLNLDISNTRDNGADIAIDSQDRYMVLFSTTATTSGSVKSAIMRLNYNGTIDTTYGTNGYHIYEILDDDNVHARNIRIDSHDRAVFVATDWWDSSPSGSHEFVLGRTLPDGTLDTRVNDVGYVTYVTNHNINYFWHDGYFEIDSHGRYVATYSVRNDNDEILILRYENLFQIIGLESSNLVPTYNSQDIRIETDNGAYGVVPVLLHDNGDLAAELETDLTEDRDWSELVGEVDDTEKRTYLSDLSDLEGLTTIGAIYIPFRDGDNAVGICPEAEAISEVEKDCSSVDYVWEDDPRVSIVEIDGQMYWRVDGNGTNGPGLFSTFQALPETGNGMVYGFLPGLIFVSGFVGFRKRVWANYK